MRHETPPAPTNDDDELPPWLGERFSDFADKYCNPRSPARHVSAADNAEADA